MVKPSRHRRPLLTPFPHLLHATRFGIRSRKNFFRACRRIQCPASVVNRPGDIADPNVVDDKVNTAQASSPSPAPPDYSDYFDEFKSLGEDRLLPPYDLNDPSDFKSYKEYLETFYRYHKGPGPSASFAAIADAASQCLEKENNMKFWWKAKRAFSCVREDFVLSEGIVDSMCTAIAEKEDFLPFAVDAGPCIAKEAELITEWLTKRGPSLTNEEYALCHKIRSIAYGFFDYPGKWSIYIAAALLGIRKEAEWLIENLKHGSVESISTSMKIRQSALDFIKKMLDEYSLDICEESSEMAFESDDDVAAIEENTGWDDREELDSGHSKKLRRYGEATQAVRVS